MWFYSNLEWEKLLDGEFNSSSNKHPIDILLVDTAPQQNEKYMKKLDVDINITFFMYFSFLVE